MNELWWRQIRAVIRLELKKTFFTRRGLWVYLLALAPVLLFVAHTFVELHLLRIYPDREAPTLEQTMYMFAGSFQFFFLRLAIFFGCLGIFTNLFRGEMLDRSLHFYLLAAIKRERVLAGKYIAGLLASIAIFTASAALQLGALLAEFDANTVSRFIYQNHGVSQILAYLGITVLACIGYGSLFLAAGLLFRNPIFPAAAILLWEAANPILPALLKKFSIIFYLRSLCPVKITVPPGAPPLLALLASEAEPMSGYLGVIGLAAVSVVILFVSMQRVRTLQINYTTE